MWIVRAALMYPYTVWVGMLLTATLGVVGYLRTPTDILPNLKVPVVVIFASYRGMPAPDMEQSVVSVLERALTRSDRLDHIESRALLGIGIIRVYFRSDADPDAAAAQVAALVAGEMQNLPPGMLPPSIFKYDASAIPVGQLVISSDSDRFDDKTLLDLADTTLREELAGIEGLAAAPVFGGTYRQVQIYVDPRALEAYKLSPLEVARIVNTQSQVIPTGEMRIGNQTYYVSSNSMVPTPKEFEKIPLWSDGRKIVTLGDVASVVDAQRWRTNTVLVDGKRAVYMPLLRQAGASAVRVVDNVRAYLPKLYERGVLPEGIHVEVAFDQSQYVRDALGNLRYEAIAGAGLAGLVVLLFLTSLRATAIVALSIPLSVLAAVAGLYFTGQTLNIMTLGGLALVLGRVVDDCIVDVENTTRHLALGQSPTDAVLASAKEISLPVLLATLTTIIVFIPVTLMDGVGKYLFTPLAIAAALAIAASYVVSRTVSPLLCSLFMRVEPHGQSLYFPWSMWVVSSLLTLLGGGVWLLGWIAPERVAGLGSVWIFTSQVLGAIGLVLLTICVIGRLAGPFDHFYEWLVHRYMHALGWALRLRWLVLFGLLVVILPAGWLLYHAPQELFPEVDASEFTVHVRVGGGPRVEETERQVMLIEEVIREVVPDYDREVIVSNIGLSSRWSAIYTNNNGPHAAFTRVQLRSGFAGRHVSTLKYVESLREKLAEKFPAHDFFFETGGMIRRILNAGATAPIEVQVIHRDRDKRRVAIDRLSRLLREIPQVEDVYCPQGIDLPQLRIDVDRARASLSGLSETDVVRNVITALMSSAQLAPNMWMDPITGNPYVIGVQYPEHLVRDIRTLEDIPLTAERSRGPTTRPVTLKDVATISRSQAPVEMFHQNSRRVSQLYLGVSGNDVAGVAAAVNRILKQTELPPGTRVEVRGEVASMKSSFREMIFALVLAVLLVYLLMVAQFAAWLDPLVVMVCAPLGLIGVTGALYFTGSSLNIQSLMGVLMLVGISVSNGVLLVQFANDARAEGKSTLEAITEAARTRMRPIVMTTLATIGGLLPLAIHLHPGDEMNLPLARAVIGGMLASTLLTLFAIPVLYTMVKPATRKGTV